MTILKRKNPILRTRLPTLPPAARSRVALGLTAAAALGRFELQQCRECGMVQYPPREACQSCLSDEFAFGASRPPVEIYSRRPSFITATTFSSASACPGAWA